MAGQQLNNSDFRKLLMTPRSGNSEMDRLKAAGGSDESKKISEAERRKRRKIIEERKQKQKLDEKYRDRAAERREGKNTDYEEQEQLLAALQQAQATVPVLEGEELQADARRQKEIADSKYLGGDIHHTHLVKGLDYALLERTREDVGAAADPQALDDALDDAAAALADAQAAAVKERQEEGKPGFKTRMARAVYETLFDPPDSHTRDFFAPGRMAYTVRLGSSFEYDDYSEVPTTVIRSKAEVDVTRQKKLTTNDIIVNKLVHIWDLVRSRKEEARQRKKERRAARKQTLTAGGEPTLDGTDGTDGTALAPGAGILSHTKPVDTDADMDMDDGAEDEIGNGAEAGAGETEADAALANVDIFGDAGDDYKPREKAADLGGHKKRVSFRMVDEVEGEGPLPARAAASTTTEEDATAHPTVPLAAGKQAVDAPVTAPPSTRDVHPSAAFVRPEMKPKRLQGLSAIGSGYTLEATSERGLARLRAMQAKDSYGDEYYPGGKAADVGIGMGLDSGDEDDEEDTFDGPPTEGQPKKRVGKKARGPDKSREKHQLDNELQQIDTILKKRGSSGVYGTPGPNQAKEATPAAKRAKQGTPAPKRAKEGTPARKRSKEGADL